MKKLPISIGITLLVMVVFPLALSESSNAQFAGNLALFVVADAVTPNDAENELIFRLEDMENPEPIAVSIKSTLMGFTCSNNCLSIK